MSNYKPFKKDKMTIEEANKLIQELLQQNPNKLTQKGKKLFEAIMKIADERDYYKKEYGRLKKEKEYFKSIKDCDEEFEL